MSLDWIYWAISQILLFWHSIWSKLLPSRAFLATNWDWILAIVFLVITVRVILFPLFVKQVKSQRAMQALAPKMKELQEKYRHDRETLQKEMIELYRKEKANPLMGCLPLFLQAPVFLGLLHVLRRVNPDLPRNKTLYGWTVAQFDSASHARLFGAPIYNTFQNGGTGVKIVAGILVFIMIITTYFTSRQMILKTGWSEDPNQRMVQRLMLYGIPFTLLISGGVFPIGVIIYWVVSNIFSLGQQFWVLRKYPPLVTATSAAAGKAGAATASKTAAGRATTGKLFARKKADPAKSPNGRAAAKPGSTAAPRGESKARAPKVGAKPINPKKGGAKAKRAAS